MPSVDRLTAPSAAAGMGAGIRACARHPAYVASKFCLSCGASLCRACGAMKAHKDCPSCAVKAGGARAVTDAQWHAVLFGDALRDWRPLLVKQIIPTAAIMSAVTLVAMALFVSFGPAEGERYSIGEDYALAALWLFVAATVGSLLFSPGVYASRFDLRPFLTRSMGGFSASLVVALPLTLVVVLGGLIGEPMAAVLGFASFLLAPLIPPLLGAIQAGTQLGGWSPLESLRNILRFGKVPLISAAVALGLGGMSLLSLFYPLLLIVAGAWIAAPWFGFLALFIILIASQLCFACLMGAASTSIFRAVEDRMQFTP